MKIIITIVIGSFLFLAPAFSAEVYTWTDSKGVTHISDQPPDRSVKLKSVDSFRRVDPKQRKRYRSERDAERVLIDRPSTPQNPYTYPDQPRVKRDENREEATERERERKREEIKQLEERSLRYQQNQSDAHSPYYKKYWLDEKNRVDRELEKKKKEY